MITHVGELKFVKDEWVLKYTVDNKYEQVVRFESPASALIYIAELNKFIGRNR